MAVFRNAVGGQQSIRDLAFLPGHFSPETYDWLFTHSVLCNDLTRLLMHVEYVIV
jgi:hypothetical protein